MVKSAPLGLRINPEVKEALERAAKDDERSVAAYAERVLVAHLRERGFLPKVAA
jgi:hypothetical protein